jgi:hypothetical protein
MSPVAAGAAGSSALSLAPSLSVRMITADEGMAGQAFMPGMTQPTAQVGAEGA